MTSINRFEEAIQIVCQRNLEVAHRNKKLARIGEAIESYRARLNEAYLASKSSWERTMLREAGNRLRMMLERIRVLSREGPETA